MKRSAFEIEKRPPPLFKIDCHKKIRAISRSFCTMMTAAARFLTSATNLWAVPGRTVGSGGGGRFQD